VSIRVRVPQEAWNNVAFGCSPALEAILSLSVLVQPSHHPLHHEWVRDTRRRLPGSMKQRVADFRFSHMDYIPAGLLPEAGEPCGSFEADLARIRALPLEQQSNPILLNLTGLAPGPGSPAESEVSERQLMARASELGSATTELVRLGLEKPQELVDGFLDFLDLYWRLIFEETWDETRPRLVETIADAQRDVTKGGLASMLGALRPRIGVDNGGGEFWIRRAREERLELDAGGEILFVPSAFLWPHIGLVRESSQRLAVLYPAPFAAFDSPPPADRAEVVSLLRALGDRTRMQALKLIAERPRSTQELAQLIGISEPAMSKHLRQLAEVGVLRTRRDGYYLLYSLAAERIEPLSEMVLEYLDAPDHSGAGESGAIGSADTNL
jgi:DNA-binding transcriptional ArsR family regulator